ncbi:MAG: DUF5050 domain-containing protein [Clostridia bacterium]|nr:DUF5050 domain-containing protein [Clostridia bacterium]
MSGKRIIAVICAVIMLASVMVSCKKNENVDLTGGNGVNITDANGSGGDANNGGDAANNGSDANGSDSNGGGTANNGTVPSNKTVPVIIDAEPDYSSVKVVNANSVRSNAYITTSYFSADETYFYYVDNDSENIFKVKIDGSDTPVKLTDAKVSTVDVAADNKLVYTINMEAGMDSNSFTMDKNGNNVVDNHELLLDYFGPTTYTKNGKIYENLGINEGFDKNGVYVRNENQLETEATLLVEGYVESFCLVDNYIVMCLNSSDGYAVYRTDLNGQNMVKLFEAQAYRITVVGNMIYFINLTDDGYVHQISVDDVKKAQ